MKSSKAFRCGNLLWCLTTMCLVGVVISSCSTTPRNTTPGTQGAQIASNSWKKVSSNPPTWYPRGVAADHPTDHNSGEWVYTDDAEGTRFFVPLHGLPAVKRKAQAFVWPSPHSRQVSE
ncbi:MAG: hypothetical protein K9N23_00905 [Akkermansiaceae bacterium]|nr:hypothetical protein [Akkermansiaceae bacterium]MCF7730207.1 hypothetical protein [Akkermansiaceae bacterium]